MFRTREVSLGEFHRLCVSTAVAAGYSLILTLIARRADAPNAYKELRETWRSLNDLTGTDIMFIFAGDDVRQDVMSANIMENQAGEVVTYSTDVAVLEPKEIQWNHRLPTQLWRHYDLKTLASPDPHPPRDYPAFVHAQTDQISELRDALGLKETDIPCLHIRFAREDNSCTVKLSESRSVYEYVKRVVTAYQDSKIELEELRKHRRERKKILNGRIRNIRVTSEYAEAMRQKRALPKEQRKYFTPDGAWVNELNQHEGELQRIIEEEKAASLFNLLRNKVSPPALPSTASQPAEMSELTRANSHKAIQDVVVLIHGIRDFALWQATIRPTLQRAGFVAEPTNYGRFSLVKFLAPVPFLRRWAINEVWEQIRIVKQQYPGARMSFIAHSFGTYVMAHLIKRTFDLGAHRIVFCGSVVSYRFRFQHYQDRFEGSILNEVGTRDIWPAMAQSVTWGYGSAGTYGFRRPLVHDRWHNGAGHGYFLRPDFCEKFWVPYLRSGAIVDADHNPESPRLWVRLVSVFKIKYVLLIAIACLIYFTGGTGLMTKGAVWSQRGKSSGADIAACFANPGGYASWPVAFSSQPPGAQVRIARLFQTERDPWLETQEGVQHLTEATPACAILSQNRYRAVFEFNGERRFQDFIVTGPQVGVEAKF